MKAVGVFGSTGSIGDSTLSIIREHTDRFFVFCLVAGSNVETLLSQAEEFRPKFVGIGDTSKASLLEQGLRRRNLHCEVVSGNAEIAKLAAHPGIDVMLAAIVGIAGLPSVYEALQAGKTVALANKESLVCGGALITKFGREKLIPVDSEHSALFQCMLGNRKEDVSKLILTASGGPFLHTPIEELSRITPAQALNHPRWKMGPKVTIDSSTMFNKSLELIEAHWLFDIPHENIDVVVHPQSIIHSVVEYKDGSQIAQLSHPDMRGPISFALSWGEGRLTGAVRPLSLTDIRTLEFLPLDLSKFPAVALAREVLQKGGGAGVVFNAANERAVELFLSGKLAYPSIYTIVENALCRFSDCRLDTLQGILELDKEVRRSISVDCCSGE